MFIFIKIRCYIYLCSLYLICIEINGVGGFFGVVLGYESDVGGLDLSESV